MCNNIGLGSRLTVTVNGQNKTQFNSLKEAQDAAKDHKGSESIVRNDDGSYSLHTITDNPNQEKQVIEMAKKGETSMFSPKVVEFSLQGTFYDTALKVENSVGEKDFLSEAGSEIRGTYLEASKTGKNEFASEEDAIAAAKLHSGIEAVVKGQDASGKPVYKLYRATQEDIDKLTNNPDYKGKISAFVVPTSISLPFMYTPFTFDNVIKIPVAPNKNSSTASAPVPAPEASQPTTPASPPATSPSTPTTPASSTETSPSVSETPVTPELSQETSTPSLNFPGLNLGSSTNRDFGLSLGTPSLSLGNDPLSLTQPNILGPYSPFDPYGFGDFSFDPFFSDYMNLPVQSINSSTTSTQTRSPLGSSTTINSNNPETKTFNNLSDDMKKILNPSLSEEYRTQLLLEKYSSNIYDTTTLDNSSNASTEDMKKQIEDIKKQDQANKNILKDKVDNINSRFTSGLNNVTSEESKVVKDTLRLLKDNLGKLENITDESRKYATNPDGSLMTDEQLKSFLSNSINKIEKGNNLSSKELLLLGALAETIKDTPNISSNVRSKLEIFSKTGTELKAEIDMTNQFKEKNIETLNKLNTMLSELEAIGTGNSIEAQNLRDQVLNLETLNSMLSDTSGTIDSTKLTEANNNYLSSGIVSNIISQDYDKAVGDLEKISDVINNKDKTNEQKIEELKQLFPNNEYIKSLNKLNCNDDTLKEISLYADKTKNNIQQIGKDKFTEETNKNSETINALRTEVNSSGVTTLPNLTARQRMNEEMKIKTDPSLKEFYNVLKLTDIKLSDLSEKDKNYFKNTDGSHMTNEQFQEMANCALNKLEAGQPLSIKELTLMSCVADKAIKNNPNLSIDAKNKLADIVRGGREARLAFDALEVAKQKNERNLTLINQAIVRMENAGLTHTETYTSLVTTRDMMGQQALAINGLINSSNPSELNQYQKILEKPQIQIQVGSDIPDDIKKLLNTCNESLTSYQNEIRSNVIPAFKSYLTNCPLNNLMALINSGSDATLNKAIAAASNQVNSEIDAGFDTAANNEIRNRADSEIELANRLEESFAASDNIDSSSSNITTLLKKFREIITTLDIESYKVKKAVTSKVGIDRRFSETLKDNRSRWDQLDQAKEEYLTSFKNSSEVQKPMLTESEK